MFQFHIDNINKLLEEVLRKKNEYNIYDYIYINIKAEEIKRTKKVKKYKNSNDMVYKKNINLINKFYDLFNKNKIELLNKTDKSFEQYLYENSNALIRYKGYRDIDIKLTLTKRGIKISFYNLIEGKFNTKYIKDIQMLDMISYISGVDGDFTIDVFREKDDKVFNPKLFIHNVKKDLGYIIDDIKLEKDKLSIIAGSVIFEFNLDNHLFTSTINLEAEYIKYLVEYVQILLEKGIL